MKMLLQLSDRLTLHELLGLVLNLHGQLSGGGQDQALWRGVCSPGLLLVGAWHAPLPPQQVENDGKKK